jgi:hypothetical protein
MHSNRNTDPAHTQDSEDWTALSLLLGLDVPGPLSVDEIARAIGDPIAVPDSLERLRADGLIHRCGPYAWPTRAARRFHAIVV